MRSWQFHILHQCYTIQPVQPAPAASLTALHSTKPAPGPAPFPISHHTAVPVLFWTIKLSFVLMICFRRGLPQLGAKRDCGPCSWRRAFGTLRALWGIGSAGKSGGFLPALSPLVQLTLFVCQQKDHSRRCHSAAAAITLSPLRAEGMRVRGKANTVVVPYWGSCH